MTKLEVNSLGPLASKLATLDVQHKITAADIFHDEVPPCFGLEASMEVQQERVTFLVRN